VILYLPERMETIEAVAVRMESVRPDVYRLVVYGEDGASRALPEEFDREQAKAVMGFVAVGLNRQSVIEIDSARLKAGS
jgi:hypothetical protein